MESNRIRALAILDGSLQQSPLEPQCCRSTSLFSPLGSLIGILHLTHPILFFFSIQNLFNNKVESGVGEGNGNPLQYSCLENPMDGGAWLAAIHGVAKSRTRLSGFTFTFHFHALEKEMAIHSSVLAWRLPGMGEPGGLLSMGSHRVGQD